MQIYNIWCGSSLIRINIGSGIGPADPMDLLNEIREADSVAVSGLYDIGFSTAREAIDFLFRRLILVRAAGGLVRSDAGYCWIYRNGKWDLPKGKKEPGETYVLTAKREIEEECGLQGLSWTGQLGTTRHVYYADHRWHFKITYWYSFETKDLRVQPEVQEGIEKVEWLSPDQMENVLPKTWPSLAELLNRTRPWEEKKRDAGVRDQ